MKFWQLISVFRSDLLLLEQLLEKPEWAEYLEWYRDFKKHVNSQNRKILDAALPDQLVSSAMAICKHRFRLQKGNLYECTDSSEGSITSGDVYDLYGAEAIEQVLEKGSFPVPNA